MVMAAKSKQKGKVRIGGTVDSEVATWLKKTKGKEKFSAHLNDVLKAAMESGEEAGSVESFRRTLDKVLDRVVSLQERVESMEGGRAPRAEKRGRGRPRKVQAVEHMAGGREIDELATGAYDAGNDIQWYVSRDKHKKVKPEPLINAFNMVAGKLETGKPVTVGMMKEGYDQAAIGVPYPTFRLFYWPLIRDRLVEKKIIEKVERPGKKGVYKKR
jgi:hypothetical protein